MKKIILCILLLMMCGIGSVYAAGAHPYDDASKSLNGR